MSEYSVIYCFSLRGGTNVKPSHSGFGLLVTGPPRARITHEDRFATGGQTLSCVL